MDWQRLCLVSQYWLRYGKSVDLGVYLMLHDLMRRVGDFMWIPRIRTISLTSSSRNCQNDDVPLIGATSMICRNNGGHLNWWLYLIIAITRGISECDNGCVHFVCYCSTRVVESLRQMHRSNGGVLQGQAIFS